MLLCIVGIAIYAGAWVANLKKDLKHLPCNKHNDILDKLAEKLDKRDEMISRIEKKLDTQPCADHSKRLSKHEDKMGNSEALLHRMEGQLEILVSNSIAKSNGTIRNRSGRAFSAKNSPRVLNENGISLLKDCGGCEFLDTYMDYFVSRIRGLQPKTALDVEDLALAVLQTAINEDMFIPIKNWVYHAPERVLIEPDGTHTKREVCMDDIIFVLSLPLRDRYLEQNHID